MNFFKKFFIILIIIFISITFIDCISVGRKITELAKESGTDTSDYDKQLSELEKSLENLQDSLGIESAEEEIEEETVKEIMQDFYICQKITAEIDEEGFRLISFDI